jgi:hypothetical protein
LTVNDCGRARLGADARLVREGVDNFWSSGGLGSSRLTLLFGAVPDPESAGLLPRRFSVTHEALVVPANEVERVFYAAATRGGPRVAVDREYPIELRAVPHDPWARFAHEVATVRDAREAADALVASVQSGRDVAVVESDRPLPAGRGEVRSLARGAERVALEVEVAEEGLLVVNDAFWPGWTARVDSREVPIHPVNAIARGVVVPAGRHLVTMEYAPREVRLGIALSLLGALACAALVVVEARRGRSPARPASGPVTLRPGE